MPTKHQNMLSLLNSNNLEILDFDKALEFINARKEVFNKFATFVDTHDCVRIMDYQNPLNNLTKEQMLTLKARFAAWAANSATCGSMINERTLQMIPWACFSFTGEAENRNLSHFHRTVSYGRFFSTLNAVSVFGQLHPKIKSWICRDYAHNRFMHSSNVLLINFIREFYLELKEAGIPHLPEVPETLNREQIASFINLPNTRELRDAIVSALQQYNENTNSTSNSFIRTNVKNQFVVPTGLAFIGILCLNWVGEIHTKIRNVNKARKKLNRRIENVGNMANRYENTLRELSEVAPRYWESDSSVSSFTKYWAKKKYPTGSMVGIEIEFVGTSETTEGSNYIVCGDCDVCNNEDSDELCENGHYENDIKWPKAPFVWFKRDGSINTTKDNERMLEFQEVNIVCNINDFKDSSRIADTLNWMNSHYMKVNKTCGLHVHVDCRDFTSNMFGRKVTKMDTAMKNWIQFMVPFSRASNSYCRVFGGDMDSRYTAVNRLSFQEHQTLEIRVGSASLNPTKVKNWAKLMHYLVHTREDVSTITEFLKSDCSPNLKAFAIARIVKFFDSHKNGRTMGHPNSNASWVPSNPNQPVDPHNPRTVIPPEITEIHNSYYHTNRSEDTES